MAEGNRKQEIAMLRITLIGACRSGKTTIANMIVNNIYYQNYEQTNELTLYYKYIHKRHEGSAPDTFVLLEIEDTYGCDRIRSADHDLHVKDSIYNPWFPHQDGDLQETMRQRMEIAKRETAADAKKKHPEPRDRVPRNFEAPLGLCEFGVSGQAYSPLTKNRMAYLFVFDCNSQRSLDEAQKEYTEQQTYRERRRIRIPSFSFAVGTQTDRATREQVEVRQQAERWAQEAGIHVFYVSAAKREKIDEVFETVCEHIHGTAALWLFEHHADRGDEGADAAKQGQDKCCIH